MNLFHARPHRIALFPVVLLLVATFTFPACRVLDNLPDDAYKTMTVKNRIAGFSFEYRAYYREVGGPYIVDSDSHRLTDVFVKAPERSRPTVNMEPGHADEVVQMHYVPAAIEVAALDARKYPDLPAHVRVEGALQSWSKWSQFKLLDRSTATVAGVQAEYIVYQLDPPFPGWPLQYHAEAYFDHAGLQWWVKLATYADLADSTRADFDHVLQTLKILE